MPAKRDLLLLLFACMYLHAGQCMMCSEVMFKRKNNQKKKKTHFSLFASSKVAVMRCCAFKERSGKGGGRWWEQQATNEGEEKEEGERGGGRRRMMGQGERKIRAKIMQSVCGGRHAVGGSATLVYNACAMFIKLSFGDKVFVNKAREACDD